jgi:hypothetical protein
MSGDAWPETAEDALPDFSDRYRPLLRLAQGGMAELFLAWDAGVEPRRLCVLKRVLPVFQQDDDFVRMFHDECRLLSLLEHPNLVRTYEVVRRPGAAPFVAMEYLAGHNVRQLIQRGRRAGSLLPWELAVGIAQQAAEGLTWAHELCDASGRPLNVVHRDLSPPNLIVTWDGVVKVIDFGIARAEQRLTRTDSGTLKGKAEYLAPEQVTFGVVDARADQFALAAVLHGLLTGHDLFDADNELAALNAILHAPRPRASQWRRDLPAGLDEVILRATLVAPDGRFPSMRAFGASLTDLAGPCERPVLARRMKGLFRADFAKHAEVMGQLIAGRPPAGRLVGVLASTVTKEFESPEPFGWGSIPAGLRWVAAIGLAMALLAGVVGGLRRMGGPAAATSGSLTLRTVPPGATATIDGHPAPWASPFVMEGLPLGVHRLDVTHPERGSAAATFELRASAPRVTVSLELPRAEAAMSLLVLPPQAEVRLNGLPVALDGGQVRITGMLAGDPQRLEVRAAGFRPEVIDFVLAPQADEPRWISLQPAP